MTGESEQIPAWSSISDGTMLYADGLAFYDTQVWRCLRTHTKSSENAPGCSDLWCVSHVIEQREE